MKLHYSQTMYVKGGVHTIVLLPYEITLFSNEEVELFNQTGVLLPYEITLFSNRT